MHDVGHAATGFIELRLCSYRSPFSTISASLLTGEPSEITRNCRDRILNARWLHQQQQSAATRSDHRGGAAQFEDHGGVSGWHSPTLQLRSMIKIALKSPRPRP